MDNQHAQIVFQGDTIIKLQRLLLVNIVQKDNLEKISQQLLKLMHVKNVDKEDFLRQLVLLMPMNAINVLPVKRIQLQVQFQVMLVLIAMLCQNQNLEVQNAIVAVSVKNQKQVVLNGK